MIPAPSDYKSNSPARLYGRPWNKNEIIMVLSSYVHSRQLPRHQTASHILRLARLLGRTPSSIIMRMENFASIDPLEAKQRKGLNNAGLFCKNIYDEWSGDPTTLLKCASLLEEQQAMLDDPTIFNSAPVEMPKAFNNYELFDKVGSGGYGEIYSCVDIRSHEKRAIKIIRTDMIHIPEVKHRFIREIKSLKAINHSNVIKIYEDNLESVSEHPAFIMDLAVGNMDEIRRQRHSSGSNKPMFPVDDALSLFSSIIKAVICLHQSSERIIHRDINPANILLMPDGRWVLADFGLSKFIATQAIGTSFSTETKSGIGTHIYAAPEQYDDLPNCDERTDVYALGVLLCDLISPLRPPYERHDSRMEPPFNKIFQKATSRERIDRFQSVKELAGAFGTRLSIT